MVDINGDSKPDLKYMPPIQKRPGMENAVYLTFLSSQEEGYTTMFAVLPEQYSRGVYPSGVIGVNPSGKFIIIRNAYKDILVTITQNQNLPDYLGNLGMDFGIKGTLATITVQDATTMSTNIDLVGRAKVVPAISIDLPFNLGKKDFSYPIVLGEYRKNLYNVVLLY
ncbi:MAG: hypothetical protein N2Z76_01010 [Treponemataceae bacterium]|nr:hypothetical protein [Treponemataceae bacterium]